MKDSLNVIVTGASSGLGKEMYQYFKERGDVVVGISRRGPDIILDLLRQLSEEDWKNLLEDDFEKIDILINCAGVLVFDHQDKYLQKDMLELNLTTVWNTINNLFPLMDSPSNIINIASVSGMVGEDSASLYAASKGGVIALTKSFAKNKKFLDKGITVNCISPGFFNTNLVAGDAPEELLERVPLKREADPKEILPVIEMILKTPYMTGANIVIDGGLTLCC